MAIENGDVIQCVVDFVTAGGLHEMNKFSWVASFVSPLDESAVVTAVVAALDDLYDEVVSQVTEAWNDPDVFLDKIAFVEDEWTVVANIGESSIDTSFANTDENLPLTCAAYMVGRTARPRSRGRKWLPTFGEDMANSGVMTQAALDNVVDCLGYYIDDIPLGGGSLLVPGCPSVVTGEFLPFTGGLTNQIMGTQRRRRQTVGI